MAQSQNIRRLVLSALFLALGLLLPFLTAQIPEIGNMLLPMHIPVLLCGFLCGWSFGLVVGFITPLLRSVLFGMPPMLPVAVAMAFELAAYGAFTGLLIRLLRKDLRSILIALVGAMIVGRAVWGLASLLLYTLMGNPFAWEVFFAGAVLRAVPGIIIQIIIVPAIVLAVWKSSERAYGR
ncbi:MAG: ECF transporter S component [Clostridia bacterium]|nr:ECF transporter S component [Clostridia bacterium]